MLDLVQKKTKNPCEAVSKAYKARNVERLVDLIVVEAASYTGEPDRMATLALKIFKKATNKYNE
ncbi:MAG: hypothetical protein WED05_05415 [Candidatus Atabeyarchaeum deiterrae]